MFGKCGIARIVYPWEGSDDPSYSTLGTNVIMGHTTRAYLPADKRPEYPSLADKSLLWHFWKNTWEPF